MQKSSTIYFWLGSWQYCQKRYPLKKYFPSYVKLFIFILNIHIIFCRKNRKNVLQIEIKEWNFEAYLLTEEPISWLLLIESWKMTCTRSYGWFLIFLSNSVGLDCFPRPNVLPKLSKITVTYPKSGKKNKWVQFWLAQSHENEYQLWTAQSLQNDQFKHLNIFSHREARIITFGQHVNLI